MSDWYNQLRPPATAVGAVRVWTWSNMVKPRSCPEKFAAARALPVATLELWYAGAILDNCWHIIMINWSFSWRSCLGDMDGCVKKTLVSCYGPKVAAALVQPWTPSLCCRSCFGSTRSLCPSKTKLMISFIDCISCYILLSYQVLSPIYFCNVNWVT